MKTERYILKKQYHQSNQIKYLSTNSSFDYKGRMDMGLDHQSNPQVFQPQHWYMGLFHLIKQCKKIRGHKKDQILPLKNFKFSMTKKSWETSKRFRFKRIQRHLYNILKLLFHKIPICLLWTTHNKSEEIDQGNLPKIHQTSF